MTTQYMFDFLMGGVMVIYGLCGVGQGLVGFIKRRPVIFTIRQSMWMILLAMAIGLLGAVPILMDMLSDLEIISNSWSIIFLGTMVLSISIFALAPGILIIIFWRQMEGYSVWGINEISFRDGLVYALVKLNLPFEETRYRFRLQSLDADLQVTSPRLMGIAHIRIKPYQQRQWIKKIALAMNEYYEKTAVNVNYLPFEIFMILGIVMVIISTGVFCLGMLQFSSHILY
jgi:hypothetical protein